MVATLEYLGASRRHPGRPRRETPDSTTVPARIATVTESLLKQYSHHDLTERQIAEAANVDQKMIHYYFGDKNGLIFDLTSRYTEEVAVSLKKLCEIDPTDKFVTRRFFEILIDSYFEKPWFLRVMASEYPRADSPIMKRFFEKYGSLGNGTICIQKALDRLVKLGVFTDEVDTHLTALTIISLFGASYMRFSLLSNFGLSNTVNQRRRREWIEHLADLFGRQLLPAARSGVH